MAENAAIMEDYKQTIKQKVYNDMYGRKAISTRYPKLTPFIVGVRRLVNVSKNTFDKNLARKKSAMFFSSVIARHSSPLFRKLGDSDPHLQDGKIQNLKIAIDALDGLIIEPNEVFSLWNVLGKPTTKKGYVNGMLLSKGKVIEGIGGGLCQLSNLLYWLFLHTSVEIVERKHHSVDVFPDSGRNIPFGSGATIYYNLIDLKIKNKTETPLQLKLWLSENQLKGQILSTQPSKEKYHLTEKEHHFVQTENGIYRYNEVWRTVCVDGKNISEERIIINCAPVMYDPPKIDLILDK